MKLSESVILVAVLVGTMTLGFLFGYAIKSSKTEYITKEVPVPVKVEVPTPYKVETKIEVPKKYDRLQGALILLDKTIIEFFSENEYEKLIKKTPPDKLAYAIKARYNVGDQFAQHIMYFALPDGDIKVTLPLITEECAVDIIVFWSKPKTPAPAPKTPDTDPSEEEEEF